MILEGSGIFWVVLVALAIDALFGDPRWLYQRAPHPVVLFGKAISWLDDRFNHPRSQSTNVGRLYGLLAIVLFSAIGFCSAWGLQELLMSFGAIGGVSLAIVASTLIAQKSLHDHVRSVEDQLALDDLGSARRAVSMIVGRDPNHLDKSGISRAAIESLAENFSDGIVAPLFWFLLLGLPGLVVYKIINTADSMIGHRNERYECFGWASARLDDGLNFVPARLSALLLMLSPCKPQMSETVRGLSDAYVGILLDAPRHRSPNAGWPEAAMAQRLNVALSGPRIYEGKRVEELFVNDNGRHTIGAVEIANGLALFRSACVVEFTLIGLLALVF